MNPEFFRRIERQSNELINQRDSLIQINAFKMELAEDIRQVDSTRSFFSFATNYERKIMICKNYFNHLWDHISGSKRNDDFKGFVCYNIARAAEQIDPSINSFDFFVQLFQEVHEAR